MRHRKVINLYDSDPAHDDLLCYLEQVEGRNRQQQALLNMLLIGFRVVSRQMSGEAAYFSERNPDVAEHFATRATAKRASARKNPPKTIEQTPQGSHKPGTVGEVRHKEVVTIEQSASQSNQQDLPGHAESVSAAGDDDSGFIDPLQQLSMMGDR